MKLPCGDNPLQLAVRNNNEKMVELLMQYDVQVSYVTYDWIVYLYTTWQYIHSRKKKRLGKEYFLYPPPLTELSHKVLLELNSEIPVQIELNRNFRAQFQNHILMQPREGVLSLSLQLFPRVY